MIKIVFGISKTFIICGLLFSLFILSNYSLHAQVKLIEKKSIDTEDNITKAIALPETGDLVFFFSNKIKEDTIREGGYKGYPTIIFEKGLLYENGSRILLAQNEIILDNYEDKILTKKIDWATYRATLKLYQIKTNDLILINQLEKSGEFFGKFLSNGCILINDVYELAGREVEIYNENFDFIFAFRPYGKHGFEHMEFCDNGKNLMLIVRKNNYISKVLVIDFNTMTINHEKEYDGLSCSLLRAYGDYFVCYGSKKLSTFNKTGEIIWQKDVLIPGYKLIGSSKHNSVLICTKNEIQNLNITDGKVVWEKNIYDLYNIELITKPSDLRTIKIRPLCFRTLLDDEAIGLIIGQTKKGTLLSYHSKYEYKSYILDFKGNIINVIEGDKRTSNLQFIDISKRFMIINDKEVQSYENEK